MKIAKQDSFGNISDLYDKMRKLQKHQAFEAEIVANTDRIKAVKQVVYQFTVSVTLTSKEYL